jgi:uncharacterized membrane protein YbhN (UPF0104 family)
LLDILYIRILDILYIRINMEYFNRNLRKPTWLFIILAALCRVCWFPSIGIRFREIIKTEDHASKAKL